MDTKKTARKGFTTVELVIVIAVIAILAVVLVPTFSGLIEKANLSSDKQNVRNMNICLTTEIASKIKIDKPGDFGAVRNMLIEYGYGKDDNFKAKTKGHSFRWFVDDRGDNDKSNDKSVIALVNNTTMKIVFPEEYKNNSANNIRKFFDLSLPAMKVENEEKPGTIPSVFGDLNLAVKYIFDANDDSGKEYNDWHTNYYIRIDVPDKYNGNEYDVVLAGFKSKVAEEIWELLPVTDIKESDGYIALLPPSQVVSYRTTRDVIDVFQCGVVDPRAHADLYQMQDFNAPPAETELTVELWLINPDNPEDIRVIGVYNYTFQ